MSTATQGRLAAPPVDIDPAEVNQVTKWILSGATAYDVHEVIREKFPTRDPGALILAAMEGLQRAADFQQDVVIGWCFEASRDLYRRMVEIGDFAGALRAVKQIADLAGKHVQNGQDDAGSKASE